jgi:hypothetical protein
VKCSGGSEMQGGTNGMEARSVNEVKKEVYTAGTKYVIASFVPAPLKGRWGNCGLLLCCAHGYARATPLKSAI